MRAYSKNILIIFRNISNIKVLPIAPNKICFCHKWFKKFFGGGPPPPRVLYVNFSILPLVENRFFSMFHTSCRYEIL
jgi:hypothetical protein